MPYLVNIFGVDIGNAKHTFHFLFQKKYQDDQYNTNCAEEKHIKIYFLYALFSCVFIFILHVSANIQACKRAFKGNLVVYLFYE